MVRNVRLHHELNGQRHFSEAMLLLTMYQLPCDRATTTTSTKKSLPLFRDTHVKILLMNRVSKAAISPKRDEQQHPRVHHPDPSL